MAVRCSLSDRTNHHKFETYYTASPSTSCTNTMPASTNAKQKTLVELIDSLLCTNVFPAAALHAVSHKRRNSTSNPRSCASFYADPSRPAAFCAASCSRICLDQYLEGANLSGWSVTCQLHASSQNTLTCTTQCMTNIPRASCICAPSLR